MKKKRQRISAFVVKHVTPEGMCRCGEFEKLTIKLNNGNITKFEMERLAELRAAKKKVSTCLTIRAEHSVRYYVVNPFNGSKIYLTESDINRHNITNYKIER